MGEVGLEQDAVVADRVHQGLQVGLLEPERGVQLALEVLGRQQRQLGARCSGAFSDHLVVDRLEDERDPARRRSRPRPS